MKKYSANKIEKKWQKAWRVAGIYEPDMEHARRPFFNLMMFPYPSAEGLHVGNMYAFTGSDIYGRFKRLQGCEVFEPIGLDGFGIHSENYALKINAHPLTNARVTEKRFYKQLEAIGNGFSWSARLETYNPLYYRWTQWVFLQLFKAGLAYKKESPVNFCPSCKTVLADEQVIQGKCERCSSVVEGRYVSQWFFKTTAYVKKLLENLNMLDWSDKVKVAQRNWIGETHGVRLNFPISNFQLSIEVFTTRIDTLFGVTYVAVSPLHPLLSQLPISSEAKSYIANFLKKPKVVADGAEKTGACTDIYVVHPVTNEKIPLYVADYVGVDFGTGAVMGVPAHDQHDLDFAQKFNLPVKEVIMPRPGYQKEQGKAYGLPGILINSGDFTGQRSEGAKIKISHFLESKNIGKQAVVYKLRDWLISRQSYWGAPIPIIYCSKCRESSRTQFSISKHRLGIDYTTIDGKEYAVIPVPEKELPVKLPFIEDFKPMGTGKSPLANHPEFFETLCPVCKNPALRETDVCDTFLDSSWYYFGYLVVNQNKKTKSKNFAFNQEIISRWLPVNRYIGGAEHSVLHLLYARFIAMVLHDLKIIPCVEPFAQFRAHGLLVKDGAKMSKSKGNIVVPDEYIKKYGADTFRLYLMFLGPFDQGGDFRDEGINGVKRFLLRVWAFAHAVKNKSSGVTTAIQNSKLEKILHQTIKKVGEDIEALRYNTAISSLMILLNAFEENVNTVTIEHLQKFLILLAPLAPHITEELWQELKNSETFKSIFQEPWPEYDPKLLEEQAFILIVQINGKVRDQISAPFGISEIEAKDLALGSEKIKSWLRDQAPKKIIYVPNKLINIVI